MPKRWKIVTSTFGRAPASRSAACAARPTNIGSAPADAAKRASPPDFRIILRCMLVPPTAKPIPLPRRVAHSPAHPCRSRRLAKLELRARDHERRQRGEPVAPALKIRRLLKRRQVERSERVGGRAAGKDSRSDVRRVRRSGRVADERRRVYRDARDVADRERLGKRDALKQ